MDNQSYLNKITTDLQKSQKPKSNFLSSKAFLFTSIIVGVFILIAIANAIVQGVSSKAKNTTITLTLHTTNLISTISEYQPSLKSSKLRGYSASLSSILSETSSALSAYIEEEYDLKQSKYDKNLISSEESILLETNNEHFSAKINGILDRTYAHTMTYEISIITAYETEVLNSTKNQNLKTTLESSLNSLSNLYENFNNFSES